MAGGFTARADVLAAGSGRVTAQASHCEELATAVVETIAQMGGAAGHPGLTSALAEASEVSTETFLVTGGLFAHVAQGLEKSAGNYGDAEQTIIARLQEIP
jgi:hypothetical protein